MHFYQMLMQNTTWNWETTNTDNIAYPDDFLWGTATAAHQVEGGHTNNNYCFGYNGISKR